jgi:hypothetical protein
MPGTTTDDATSEETEEIDEETETGSQDDANTDAEGDENALGDAGKKALDAMKLRVKEANKAAREAKDALAIRDAELALKDKPADEQALEKARAEARAETLKTADERIVKANLRAAATGKLADPSDVFAYPKIIDLSSFSVDEDGDVDSDELNEAIEALLAAKPHLAAQKQNRFNGDADGGAKGKSAKPAQLSRSDVESMSTEQIIEAQNAGQLDRMLGFK